MTVSWLRTKKVVRKKLVRNIPLVILRSEVTKDLETQSGCTQILPPDGRQDDTIKKTLTKTSTKTNNYGKQQQKHVGQDSPRSNHHSNRHRNHLRRDIVHGAVASEELKKTVGVYTPAVIFLRKVNTSICLLQNKFY